MNNRKNPTRPALSGLTAALLGFALAASAPGALADSRGSARSEVDPSFARYDTDKDGYISPEEFKRMGGKPEAFKEMDSGGDGRLNPEEFTKAHSLSDRMKAAEYVDDTWITTRVKAMLLKDKQVSGLDVKVETKDGVVLLSGFVKSQEQAARAVEIAAGIQGVRQVINSLVVQS